MKTKLVRNAAALAGLVTLVAGSLQAAGWSHFLSSPNGSSIDYAASVTVPAAASVQQSVAVYNAETVGVNSGPLGYYQVNSSNSYAYASGSAGSGTYSIYQALVRGADMGVSGYSVTVINW